MKWSHSLDHKGFHIMSEIDGQNVTFYFQVHAKEVPGKNMNIHMVQKSREVKKSNLVISAT